MKTFFFAVQPWYIKPQTTTTPPSSLTHSLSNIAFKNTSPFKYYSSDFNDARITLVTLPNNISTFTAATTSSSSVSEINYLICTWLLLVQKSVPHFFSSKWSKVADPSSLKVEQSCNLTCGKTFTFQLFESPTLVHFKEKNLDQSYLRSYFCEVTPTRDLNSFKHFSGPKFKKPCI